MEKDIQNAASRRIESYLAEVFPNVRDCITSLVETEKGTAAVRTYNLGCRVGESVTIEEACEMLGAKVLERLQVTFGVKPYPVTFYWRERPVFNTWEEDGVRMLALWFRFTLEGWTLDKSLREFLGVNDALAEVSPPMQQATDLSPVNWIPE